MFGCKRVLGYLFCVALVVSMLNAQATSVSYALGMSLGYYDNVNLVNKPQSSELSESVRGRLSIEENSPKLQLSLDTALRTINYTNNQTSGRNVGNLSATALWMIKPKHLEWFFSNVFTQAYIDSFQPNQPSNQRNFNAIVTGPNYIMRLSSRDSISIEARISKYTNENFVDNERLSYSSRWIHTVNSAADIGLNYEVEKTNYLSQINTIDFKRNDVFFNIDYRKNLNTFTASIGNSSIINEVNKKISDATFYSATLQNQRTKTSNISITYDKTLTDTGRQLLRAGAINTAFVSDNQLAVVSTDTYINERKVFKFNKRTRYGNLVFLINENAYEYTIQSNLDRKSTRYSLAHGWALLRGSNVSLQVYKSYTAYNGLVASSREDVDYVYRLSYAYNARRNIKLAFDTTKQRRESNFEALSYNDVRFFVTIEYSVQ